MDIQSVDSTNLADAPISPQEKVDSHDPAPLAPPPKKITIKIPRDALKRKANSKPAMEKAKGDRNGRHRRALKPDGRPWTAEEMYFREHGDKMNIFEYLGFTREQAGAVEWDKAEKRAKKATLLGSSYSIATRPAKPMKNLPETTKIVEPEDEPLPPIEKPLYNIFDYPYTGPKKRPDTMTIIWEKGVIFFFTLSFNDGEEGEQICMVLAPLPGEERKTKLDEKGELIVEPTNKARVIFLTDNDLPLDKDPNQDEPALPLAEGVYGLCTTDNYSHFVYELIMSSPNVHHEDFGLKNKDQFVIGTGNPFTNVYEIDEERPDFRQRDMRKFKEDLRIWTTTTPSHLNTDNAKFLLMAKPLPPRPRLNEHGGRSETGSSDSDESETELERLIAKAERKGEDIQSLVDEVRKTIEKKKSRGRQSLTAALEQKKAMALQEEILARQKDHVEYLRECGEPLGVLGEKHGLMVDLKALVEVYPLSHSTWSGYDHYEMEQDEDDEMDRAEGNEE